MGVYGNFLNAFPELKRKVDCWNDKAKYTVVAIYFDNNMVGMRGFKTGKQNTVVDVVDQGVLYIAQQYTTLVSIGDYCRNPFTQELMRITKRLAYDYMAGYGTWQVERVTGPTEDHDEQLKVKGARFD